MTVSLPIDWVRKQHLKPGDEISIDEDGSALRLSGAGSFKPRYTVHVTVVHQSALRTIISGAYRMGYSELEITADQPLPFTMVQSIVRSLVGYEVSFHTKNSCIIIDVLNDAHESSRALVGRLFQLADLIFHFHNKTTEELDLERVTMLRLRDYALRVVIAERTVYSHELYTCVILVEKLAATYLEALELKLPLSSFAARNTLLRNAYEAFRTNDVVHTERIYLQAVENLKLSTDKLVHRFDHAFLGVASRLRVIVCFAEK